MCKGLMYNLDRDTHLPHEGSVFALSSKSAVVRHISTFPIRGKNSATDETAHCRDGCLPVMYVCGRTFIYQGDTHVLSNNQASQNQKVRKGFRKGSGSDCSTQKRNDVFGRFLTHDARPCLRDVARAFGKNQAGQGSELARRSDHIIHESIQRETAYVATKPIHVRSDFKRKQKCTGVGRAFLHVWQRAANTQVNNFNSMNQAFLQSFVALREGLFCFPVMEAEIT